MLLTDRQTNKCYRKYHLLVGDNYSEWVIWRNVVHFLGLTSGCRVYWPRSTAMRSPSVKLNLSMSSIKLVESNLFKVWNFFPGRRVFFLFKGQSRVFQMFKAQQQGFKVYGPKVGTVRPEVQEETWAWNPWYWWVTLFSLNPNYSYLFMNYS